MAVFLNRFKWSVTLMITCLTKKTILHLEITDYSCSIEMNAHLCPQKNLRGFDWQWWPLTSLTLYERCHLFSANINLFKINNENTRIMFEIFSKFTIKMSELHRNYSEVFIVNSEVISHNFLLFPLLTLKK